jgi:hypothetical protein
MAGRKMRAWRGAIPRAARVADEAYGRGVLRLLLMNPQLELPVLERDGRANLVYRDFERAGASLAARWQNHGAGAGAKRESKRFRNE